MDNSNKYGLSKKTNVAVAAISGITVVANVAAIQSVVAICAIIAISAIAFYHLTIQGRIDLQKHKQVTES